MPPENTHAVPEGLRLAIHEFAFWYANGTVGYPLLEGIDYLRILVGYPSEVQNAFAVFVNTLRLDDEGNAVNAKEAEFRAAQFIRCFCDPEYELDPPVKPGECAL
jgi:hypothetical protein